MAYDTDTFRTKYRSGIHRYYSGLLHGGFVFTYAAAFFAYFVSRIHDVRPLEWLAVPATLVFFNWGEYTVHKSFGHTKRANGTLFYERHTGDHHSFFVESRMPYGQARDFRVILFPPWLIVVYTLVLAVPAYVVLGYVSESLGAIVAATLVFGYLVYEFFHTTQHLPDSNPLTKLPWIRTMRRHHAIHHRRAVMRSKNFNLTFPLMDWLVGTLYTEADERAHATTGVVDDGDDAGDAGDATSPSAEATP